MKPIHLSLIITMFCFACNKDDVFRSETDEHFSIIQEEIRSMPEIPIAFYWELPVRGPLTTATPVTSCLTTEVRFEKPYIVVNGKRFHAYYWTRTENKIDGPSRSITSMIMAFNKEK